MNRFFRSAISLISVLCVMLSLCGCTFPISGDVPAKSDDKTTDSNHLDRYDIDVTKLGGRQGVGVKTPSERFDEYRNNRAQGVPEVYDQDGNEKEYMIITGSVVKFSDYYKDEYEYYLEKCGVGCTEYIVVTDAPLTMDDGTLVSVFIYGRDERGFVDYENMPTDIPVEMYGTFDYIYNGEAWNRGGPNDETCYLDALLLGEYCWCFNLYDINY